MKKVTLICTIIAVTVGFFWALHTANIQAQEREEMAENSSVDGLQFSAAGLRGETFVIAENNSVDCDYDLDIFANDPEMAIKIRRVGFTKVSCGGQIRNLP